jgi:hypothetical protein
MGFPRRLAIVALVVPLVATSCGGAKYRYVNNSQSGLFFKVPKSWTYYRLTDADANGRIVGSSAAVETWHVAFDAASQPTTDHLKDMAAGSPVGEVRIFALGSSLTTGVSEAELRQNQFPFDFDPAYPPQSVNGQVELISYNRVVTKKGLHGSRVAFNVKPDPATNDWVTYDGVSLFDPATQSVFFITLHCAASCYKDNQKTVDEIITSWTVNR